MSEPKRKHPPGVGRRKGRDGKLYWYARVSWQENGKTRTKEKRARTVTHARDLRAQMLLDLRGRGPELLTGERLTFAQLAARYAEAKLIEPVYAGDTKIAGQRSWRNQLSTLKPLVDYFGARRIKAITYEDLLAYRQRRFETPTRYGAERAIAGLNRELSLLRAILNFAIRSGWLARSPFDAGQPLISAAAEHRRDRVLTPDEESRLLAVCVGRRAHLHYLIVMAVETAMRRGELLALRWDDIDLDQGIITVRASTTKTRRPRRIGITARLKKALTQWARLQTESDLVFAGLRDIKRAFGTARLKAGIIDLRFHDLRHTAITRMVAAGLPPAQIMKITGHSRWETFARYVNLDAQAVRTIAETMDKISESINESASEFIN